MNTDRLRARMLAAPRGSKERRHLRRAYERALAKANLRDMISMQRKRRLK